jgi:hypothetical protein
MSVLVREGERMRLEISTAPPARTATNPAVRGFHCSD